MNSSQQQPVPGRGREDPSHIAPFLTPLVTQPQASPQNGGRLRKSAKSKMQGRIREDRRREPEEPRFNIAAPVSPRTHRKPQQRTPRVPAAQTMMPFSRDTMTPDYPPPSFQEAISESSPPPFNVVPAASTYAEIVSSTVNSRQFPQTTVTTSSPSAPVPAAISPGPTSTPLHEPTDLPIQNHSQSPSPLTPSSQQTSTPSDGSDNTSDTSSIEVVDLSQSQDETDRRLDLSQEWKADRRRGLPLKVRIQRDFKRQHPLGSTSGTPSGSPHRAGEDISTHAPCPQPPHRCTYCGRPKPSECDIVHAPARYSPGDYDSSPPMSPRGGRFTWKKLFAPIVANERGGPSSPIMSPRSPLTGLPTPWASTLTLGLGNTTPPNKSSSPTPPHKRKDSFSVKKLFGSKGKEREFPPDSDVADTWELLDGSSDSDLGGHTGHEVTADQRETLPAGNMRAEPPPRARAPPVPAFLDRPVRHSPQPISRPLFSSSSANLPLNGSSVNLPEMLSASPRIAKRLEPPKEKIRHVSPLLSPALRDVTSTSSVSLPSMVGKSPPVLQDTPNTPTMAAPLSPRQRSRSEGRHAVPRPEPWLDSTAAQITPILVSPPARLHTGRSPARARSPTLPGLTVPQTAFHASPRIYVRADQDADIDTEGMAPSSPEESSISPVTPTYVRDGKYPATRISGARRQSPSSPRARSSPPFVGSSPLQESPPPTPTTPTYHHYPGRPLPHPPVQPSPRTAAPAIVTIATSELPEYGAAHYALTELEHSASRLEDEYKEETYEDDLTEPPSPYAESSFVDIPGQRLSTVGRVERRDNRVKVKLILMGREVDKCRICLCQFKEDELAVYGTNCTHVFHEYCLNKWLDTEDTCPMCRKPCKPN